MNMLCPRGMCTCSYLNPEVLHGLYAAVVAKAGEGRASVKNTLLPAFNATEVCSWRSAAVYPN